MGKRAVDFSTVIGVTLAFGLIVTAILLGGSIKTFMDAPSSLIVIGGTIAVVTACFSFKEILGVFVLVSRTTRYSIHDATQIALRLIEYAETARKSGFLGLQDFVEREDNPLLRKGLSMLVDGYEPQSINRILQQKISSRIERHDRGVSVLRKAAEVSPAMGLIGTLIGLVQMLGNLDDPSQIGPAMAVALLTTLYGAILAYVIFTPLASKLERNSREESLIDTICLKGVASIANQDNPRQLEAIINTILPPEQNISFFE